MAFAASCGVPGDYLEFGVYSGNSFTAAYHFARMNNLAEMRFYAFDSFKGMPHTREHDVGASTQHGQGGYACSRAQFEKIIFGGGMDSRRVEILEGWYDEILTAELKEKLPIDIAAVISADCGLYESTSTVLEFIDDYVQDGTILIFGDWFSFRGSPDRGQRRAFAEWLAARPAVTATEFHKFGWHGMSYILHLQGEPLDPVPPGRPAARCGDSTGR
jgi:hypothetical protein